MWLIENYAHGVKENGSGNMNCCNTVENIPKLPYRRNVLEHFTESRIFY